MASSYSQELTSKPSTSGSGGSSSRKKLVDDNDEPKSCIAEYFGQYDPRKDPIEFCCLIAMLLLTVGITLVAAGYIIPRDYVFDPNKDAREMEAIELHFKEQSRRLDICLAVGMTCVGLGGLILAGIITVLLVKGEFISAFKKSKNTEKQKLHTGKPGASVYGTQLNDMSRH